MFITLLSVLLHICTMLCGIRPFPTWWRYRCRVRTPSHSRPCPIHTSQGCGLVLFNTALTPVPSLMFLKDPGIKAAENWGTAARGWWCVLVYVTPSIAAGHSSTRTLLLPVPVCVLWAQALLCYPECSLGAPSPHYSTAGDAAADSSSVLDQTLVS